MSLYALSEGYQNTPSLTAGNSVGLNPLAYNLDEEKPSHRNKEGVGEHGYTNQTAGAGGRMKDNRETQGTVLPRGGYWSKPGGVFTVGDAPPIHPIPGFPERRESDHRVILGPRTWRCFSEHKAPLVIFQFKKGRWERVAGGRRGEKRTNSSGLGSG